VSTEKLRLEVLLAAIDKVSGPFKSIQKGTGELARALKGAKDKLKDLQTQQADIAAYQKAGKELAITANAFKTVQERVQRLQAEMEKAPEKTAKMIKALKDAQTESDRLKDRHQALTNQQQQLFTQMKAGGIDVSKLADHSRDLAARQIEAANATKKLGDAFEAQRHKAERLATARKAYDKSLATAGKLRDVGYGVSAAGAVMGLPAAKATKDYATFEDAMLGVARQVDGARDANGKLTATYYEMGKAIKAMSERIPLATTEIAAIVEAGARMGIQGKDNLLTYTETTAVMAEAFKLPVDQIGENIGKISQLYKIPIKDIKALGDTINWLDDNALSKGGDIIDVMQRIAGAADMVKMSYRDAAALGSTFLSLGARPEVAATATNAMIGQLANAPMLATAKRYRGGLDMLGISAASLQRGMNRDATGTIIKVLDAIKRLPQEKQLEAATRLFGKEYGDDAAKLAQNMDEYRRQLQLVNEARARGSMQREADARKEVINARLQMARNALFNLSSDLGEHLKPALVETMEKALAIVQAVRAWAQENPALAAGLMTAVKWLALATTAIGGLIFAAGAVLVPLAAVKFALAYLGIASAGAIVAGIKAIGMAILMSPLAPWALLIGAVAAAIYYKWEPIKKFFGELWDYLKPRFEAGWKWLSELPGKFKAWGAGIIDGLLAGINEKWEALKAKVKSLGELLPEWVRKPLGISSPSRVFAEIGGYTMSGLEQGILRGQDGPLSALARTARNLAGAGLLVAGGASAMPAIGAPAARAGDSSLVVQITINGAPGMDEQTLARQVAAEIQRIEQQRAARARSRLRDFD
jgi:TP901 family phage tail tape measure protein